MKEIISALILNVLTLHLVANVHISAFMNPASRFHLNSIGTSQTSSGVTTPRNKRQPLLFQSSKEAENDVSSSKSKRTTSLHFKGEKVYKSEPVPILHDTTTTNDILSFFKDDEIRSILLNGDREDSIELLDEDNINQAMLDLWTKQAETVGGDVPSMSNGDVVFQVNTGTMNFSGLKISSNSLIGVKYLDEYFKEQELSSSSSSPEYQLVFIKDKPIVEGPRLLVWIYNQLTGSSKDGEEDKEQTIRAYSRFTHETTPDGKSIIFSIESTLEVIVKFPSLLLKIMPVSKEKAEEQGSASVLKAMGKDIEAVLPKLRSYYMKTFETVSTTF